MQPLLLSSPLNGLELSRSISVPGSDSTGIEHMYAWSCRTDRTGAMMQNRPLIEYGPAPESSVWMSICGLTGGLFRSRIETSNVPIE